MKEYIGIREDIQKFVFDEIVPKYAGFDPAHKEDHALTVIEQAMLLMDRMSAWRAAQNEETASNWQEVPEREMLFIAAACHDLGLVNGRERHHLDSGIIIRNDPRLRQWFTEEDIETIAQAAEDHRASGKSAPRSIYGKIVAEADRVIDGETIIRRTVQFGFTHYPSLDREAHIKRAVEHLREKYGRGGYLKLWIPWSDNATRLNALQEMIADDSAVYREIVRIYDQLQGEA
ncbi:MAG: HD domain-containing protein [Bacteroidales bacterium]|nr:HD domain-containing protein [Bacteroidales bacterium]